MPPADTIPASGLLAISLDQLEEVRAQARADARRFVRILAWIIAGLLLSNALLCAAAFSLVVRNNLIILPDASKKIMSKPAAEKSIFRRETDVAPAPGQTPAAVVITLGGRRERSAR